MGLTFITPWGFWHVCESMCSHIYDWGWNLWTVRFGIHSDGCLKKLPGRLHVSQKSCQTHSVGTDDHPRPYITKASTGPYWFWQQASLMSTCLQTRKLSYSKLLVKLNCVLASCSVSSRHLTKLFDPTGVSPVLFPERRAGKWKVPGECGMYPPWPWWHRDWVCLSVTSMCFIKHAGCHNPHPDLLIQNIGQGRGAWVSMGFSEDSHGQVWSPHWIHSLHKWYPPPTSASSGDAHEVPMVCLQQGPLRWKVHAPALCSAQSRGSREEPGQEELISSVHLL